MRNTAYIGIGSNIGDRKKYLGMAISSIQQHEDIDIVSFSSVYETDPVGYEDQEQFLNMVIKVKTNLSAFDLLSILQEIELESGRERKIRWGPRTLDLDILLYNQDNIEAERLIIPHPRMTERAFVMLPLLEITQQVPSQLSFNIDELQDREGVRIWKRRNGEDVSELFEN